MNRWFAGAATAVAIGFVAATAQAAPGPAPAHELMRTAQGDSAAQNVDWRWRRHYRGPYGYYHAPRNYRHYRYWRPYRRYYGYGPGFGLYWGGRRHHRHWW
jgi:hypothetical protein